MRRRIFFLMLAVSLMFFVTERATVYASGISVEAAEENTIQLQAQALLNSMNGEELLRATLNDAVVSNRIVEYGTINALLMWVEGPIVDYPEGDYNEYDVGMVGYKFRCSTSIDIANVGTLKCTAVSTVLG